MDKSDNIDHTKPVRNYPASKEDPGPHLGLRTRLQKLDTPLQVVIVGAGSMGKGLAYQCRVTPGIECIGLADIRIDRAIECAEWLDRPHKVVNNTNELHDAIQAGHLAICEDGNLLAQCELSDAFIESSNAIAPAARFARTAIEHEMHLVLMNAEIDLIFGPFLKQLADQHGVTYTSCDGDQHGVIKRLVDEVRLWDFDIVMAGNIKGYLDRYANPTSIIPEADKRNLDYKMCTAYTDGTKLCIEMALVANALGYKTPVPGMHGPRADHVDEVIELFDLDRMWDGDQPVVDYILGAQPGGGIFVVGHCENSYQQDMMQYYKMGEGPYYIFYRPYHLCHVEAMQCIAEAALDGYSLLEPMHGLQTNVFAYAKRDLKKGETLDGIGGYACYGLIENCEPGIQSEGLPICLAEDVTLKRDVPEDEPIGLGDVKYDEDVLAFDWYQKALTVEKKSQEAQPF